MSDNSTTNLDTIIKDSTIIIPTFNEEGNIGRLITKLMELYPSISIIVSDDESTDATELEVTKIKEKYPNKTILYVSADKFTNQFIESLKNNEVNDFINFYHLVDVLLVDDIQFLENKHKTQEIFFHIFNRIFHFSN